MHLVRSKIRLHRKLQLHIFKEHFTVWEVIGIRAVLIQVSPNPHWAGYQNDGQGKTLKARELLSYSSQDLQLHLLTQLVK